MQIANPRSQVYGKDDRQPQQHLHSSRPFDQQDDPINNKSDDTNIEQIKETDISKDIEHRSTLSWAEGSN
jgi:hypothetical protein